MAWSDQNDEKCGTAFLQEQLSRVGLFGQGVGSLGWGCDEHSCEWQKGINVE